MNMQQTVDFNVGVRRNLVVNAGRLELPGVIAPSFSRNSTAFAHNGLQVGVNSPRYETGRFDRASMTEEGTTNLLPEAISQGRSGADSNNSAFSTRTFVSNFGRSSLFSMRSEQVAAGSNRGFYTLDGNHAPVTAGLVYTITCWVFTNHSARTAQVNVNFLNSAGAMLSNVVGVHTPLVPGEWTRLFVIATAPTDAVHARVVSTASESAIGDRYWYTDLQVEQKPYATSWQLGGTPRVGELITVPTTGVVNPVEGTVEFWWQPINQPTSDMTTQITSPQIIRMGSYFINNSWVLWNWSGRLDLLVRGAEATGWTGNWSVISGTAWHQLNRWYHMAVRWSGGNTFWVFVDGVRYGPYVSTHAFTGVAGNVMELGGIRSSGHANALYDDLRVSNHARTDAEIQAAFNSGMPAPVDAHTTYLLRLDGSLAHGQGGDYTSPEYDMSTVGTVAASSISWHAPTDEVSRTISARIDDQAWTPVANGGNLPFVLGQLVTGRRLQLRVQLRRG